MTIAALKAATLLVATEKLGLLLIMGESAFARLPSRVRRIIGRTVRTVPGFREYGRAAGKFIDDPR